MNEKIFISWVGPRGIVAAGIASLFGLKLAKNGVPGAEYITPLVFMIVLGTVLLNATTARMFAKLIGVFLTKSEGILIVGASKISRLIGHYLESNGRHVVLIDSNQNNIIKARDLGLEAINSDVYSDKLADNIELNDVGYLMALTANSEINNYVIDKFKNQFGENGTFRLVSTTEMNDEQSNPKEGLFSHTNDYNSLNEVANNYPSINEIKLESKEHFERLIERTENDEEIVPLFIKNKTGVLEIIPSNNKNVKIVEGASLVYLGKLIKV